MPIPVKPEVATNAPESTIPSRESKLATARDSVEPNGKVSLNGTKKSQHGNDAVKKGVEL